MANVLNASSAIAERDRTCTAFVTSNTDHVGRRPINFSDCSCGFCVSDQPAVSVHRLCAEAWQKLIRVDVPYGGGRVSRHCCGDCRRRSCASSEPIALLSRRMPAAIGETIGYAGAMLATPDRLAVGAGVGPNAGHA